MIGELQIRYSAIQPQFNSYNLLSELEESSTYIEFIQTILKIAKHFSDK